MEGLNGTPPRKREIALRFQIFRGGTRGFSFQIAAGLIKNNGDTFYEMGGMETSYSIGWEKKSQSEGGGAFPAFFPETNSDTNCVGL